MSRRHRFESPALQYLYDRYVGKDSKRQTAFDEAMANAEVARAIYDLRTKAGLTQTQLAGLVRTSTSAISRLEDASYDGHSLAVLRRIAAAVNARVEVRFVPLEKGVASAAGARTRRRDAHTSKAARRKKSAA